MDAQEYTRFLQLVERMASEVGILATGAKTLRPRGIYKELRRAEVHLNNAARLLRAIGTGVEDTAAWAHLLTSDDPKEDFALPLTTDAVVPPRSPEPVAVE